jgi:hypothetical protein
MAESQAPVAKPSALDHDYHVLIPHDTLLARSPCETLSSGTAFDFTKKVQFKHVPNDAEVPDCIDTIYNDVNDDEQKHLRLLLCMANLAVDRELVQPQVLMITSLFRVSHKSVYRDRSHFQIIVADRASIVCNSMNDEDDPNHVTNGQLVMFFYPFPQPPPEKEVANLAKYGIIHVEKEYTREFHDEACASEPSFPVSSVPIPRHLHHDRRIEIFRQQLNCKLYKVDYQYFRTELLD